MSMIEGIGDEVVHFFSFVLVSLLGAVAWWSTGIRERPLIRTVLILEHRSTPSGPNASASSAQPERRELDASTDTPEETPPRGQETPGGGGGGGQEPLTSADLIKHRRLVYFTRSDDRSANSVQQQAQPQQQQQQPQNETDAVDGSSSVSRDNIRIRLKYLNDDQKLVEGRLQELLGDFKRRHFSVELSANKLVRLIFNGQMLQSDDQTLQGYGFYDNCVVHCLVHQQRGTGGAGAGARGTNSSGGPGGVPPPEWNLGLVLYACLSLILCIGWFVRYHYAQLFTMATTAGLVGLTSIFAVSVIGLYMPDQEPVPSH